MLVRLRSGQVEDLVPCVAREFIACGAATAVEENPSGVMGEGNRPVIETAAVAPAQNGMLDTPQYRRGPRSPRKFAGVAQ